MNGKKILVTGGAGFIGSELVRQLITSGAEVIVVDNLITGSKENLSDVINNDCRLEILDIRSIERVERLLKPIDIIFHLACLGVRHSIHSPKENHEVNATATLDLLLASRKVGVERFVQVSSSEVYGTGFNVPMDERHPAFPMTVYGASKLAGECYARAFYRSYEYPTVIVRPFNTYGPRSHHEGDSGEVIPKFLLRCLAGRPIIIFGDGRQTRDFLFVSDTARGILLAGLEDKAVGKTINIASGKEISINDLVEEVAAITGKARSQIEHYPPRPGDTLRLYADISAARKLIGFSPTYSLREGLKKLEEWYVEQGVTPEKLLEDEVVQNWDRSQISYNG
ncbi:MAG TPA: GDP-mannose 4,6-dehydratase [bacterium]|nr:GDP-mannose 4,6-dehydratase [bacterium]